MGATDVQRLEPRRLLSSITAGTWSTITAAPGDAQTGMVLTNGSILVHGSTGNYSSSWYKLTPSSTGSYTSGTWTTVASSNVGRLYFASNVLQNGDVFTEGGEYASDQSFSRSGEIYNPVANTWTTIAPFPQTDFGDDPSELLPNGQILTGYILGGQTYIYNPTANTWTQTGTKVGNDRSDEEGWVTLPNHNILSYSVFSSISTGVPSAQVYNVNTGTWSATSNLPAQLSSASVGYELGPGLLLPDGRVFYSGGTAATAYYTPSSNSWAAGPQFQVSGVAYCSADAPGCVLPNGDVLEAMSPVGALSGGEYNFPSPTAVFELNPTTNSYINVTPSLSGFSMSNASYTYSFLVLPTGQVALMNFNTKIAVYTEAGTAVSSATPVITGISYNGPSGVYTLSGTNLNGINEGASYGDDNEMSSNYPLVRLTSASGVVTYATTTNWSNTGVMQGAETVTFTLPAADTTGAYLIQSVANGVPSATALAVLVNANTTTSVSVQTDANPASVDVVGSSVIKATFPVSAFSTIYVAGDNSGDTLSVNLNNNAGIDTYVQAGTGTDTINVNQTSSSGPVVIDPSAGNDAVNVGTIGAGTAIAQFLASQQIGLLTVGNGGSATIGSSSGTKTLLQITGINTSGSGFLDLTNNYVIVHNGNLTTLTAQLASGSNQATGGYWNGSGIVSSTAAADTTYTTAIGMILNNVNGSTLYGSGTPLGLFDGANPVLTDVLIKYTYYGDANLDGKVDGSDYSLIDNSYANEAWGNGIMTGNAVTGWYNGDFNYDNIVNGSDYTLMDNTFNTQGSRILASIAPLAGTSKSKTATAYLATSTAASLVDSAFWSDPNQTADTLTGDASLLADAQPATSFSNQPIDIDWTTTKQPVKWFA